MTASAGLSLDELLRELPRGSRARRATALSASRGAPGSATESRQGTSSSPARRRTQTARAFVEDARKRGAVAVLTDHLAVVPSELPCIRVVDTRVSLALAAAAVYGHPAFSLEIVGITGTNGKTTTAHLVRAAVDHALGRAACGLIGTVGHRYGTIDLP